MRTENIEVTFKIPIPVDKPDLNDVIYSKEAISNAYKNVKDVPIEMPCSDGQFLPIGVAQEVELIEDEDGMYITGVGLVWHGGTEESVEIKEGKVTSFKVNGIGIAKEEENKYMAIGDGKHTLADSSLKHMTKDELIRIIRCLESNLKNAYETNDIKYENCKRLLNEERNKTLNEIVNQIDEFQDSLSGGEYDYFPEYDIKEWLKNKQIIN